MKISELLKLADDAYYATQYEKAIEYYKKALELKPANKHAQNQLKRAEEQLVKAEYYLNLKSPTPEIPIEALQLYRRVRSYISTNDFSQAKSTLKQAILVAKDKGVFFKEAQDLLDNLQDAFNAKKFREKVLEELDSKKWVKAVENLKNAIESDPTDENNKTLLLHLQNLLEAQNLVTELQSGIRNTNEHADEIQKAIDDTKGLLILSTLRQEVVRQFGDAQSKSNQLRNLAKNIGWSILGATLLIAAAMTLIYISPHTDSFVDCSNIKDLELFLSYPRYTANGDNGTVKLTYKNVGQDEIGGEILMYENGIANVQFDKTRIELKNIVPEEQRSSTITFSLNEPFSAISNPSLFVEFNLSIQLNGSICTSKNYHIAISPIYKIKKVVGALWTLFGLTLFGLVRDRIFKFIGLSK